MNNQLVLAAALVGETVGDILGIDTNKDGKVSRPEVVGLIMPLSVRLFTTFPKIDFQLLLEEVRTSDTEARQAAIDVVKQKFEIDNKELELLIEDVIDFLEDLYTDIIAHFERAVDLVVRVKTTAVK